MTRASSDPPPDNLKRQPSNAHFELEPNPFEQSFSGTNNIPKNLSDTRSTAGQPQQDNHQPTPRRARSQSPVGTPSAGVTSSGPSQPPSSGSRQPVQPYQGYNRLPPLSALASPSTEALHASYWGSDNQHSLRSGPLSPAMLPGPTASTSAPSAPSSQAFDPNTFRTGLTPSISGSMANPPGPATAALFALMTNATPGGQPPNQFDLNFAQHMQQDGRRPSPPTATESSESGHSLQSKHQAAASTQSSMGSSEMSYGQSLPPHLAGIQPSQMGTSGPHLSGLPAHMQQQQHPGGHNPLYLFSQATASDFPGGNEEDLLAVNALRNLNSPQIPGVPGTLGHNSTFAQAVGGLTAAAPSSTALAAHGRPPATSMPQQPSTFQPGGSPLRSSTTSGANSASSVPTRGGKRKAAAAVSQGDTSETNARGTRKRAAAKRTKTEELSDEEEGQASMTANSTIDDMPTVKPLTKEEKKRMSEEDKRKNFLERNRQGELLQALLCRFF